jgi:hypothetical protein
MTDNKYDKIAYIRYQDHHWFESHMNIRDLEKNDRGENQCVIEEVGFIIKSTQSYIILAQGIQPPMYEDDDDDEIVIVKPTKILKRDIVQMVITPVPRARRTKMRRV